MEKIDALPKVKCTCMDHVLFRLEVSGALRWEEVGQSKDCLSKVAVVGCGCGGVEDETAREAPGLVRLQVSRRNLRLSRSTMLLGYWGAKKSSWGACGAPVKGFLYALSTHGPLYIIDESFPQL